MRAGGRSIVVTAKAGYVLMLVSSSEKSSRYRPRLSLGSKVLGLALRTKSNGLSCIFTYANLFALFSFD